MTGYTGELDGMDLVATVQELRRLKGSLGLRAKTIRDAEMQKKRAKHAWEQQRAKVRARTLGTIPDKDDAALLDPSCIALRTAYETAEAVENYAKRMAKSDESDVSSQQTIAALIRATMSLAGVQDRRGA